MAKYDLPAMVNFILKKTGQPSLHYAGHSQGSLIAFAELSRNQDLAQKIKAVFALGPVAYLGHMESPLKFLADFIPELEVIQSWKNGDLLDVWHVVCMAKYFYNYFWHGCRTQE